VSYISSALELSDRGENLGKLKNIIVFTVGILIPLFSRECVKVKS
jgi:hypothetical protein